MSYPQQLVAVQAAIDAYEVGSLDGGAHAVMVLKRNGQVKDALQSSTRHFSHTFGHYQADITDFYVTHGSAPKATMGAIMSCLADSPTFTCDQVATMASKLK